MRKTQENDKNLLGKMSLVQIFYEYLFSLIHTYLNTIPEEHYYILSCIDGATVI